MNIVSIEPTPSPNTMKVLLNQELPAGKSNNYKKDQAAQAPEMIASLLSIEGVKGIYHVADFLAIERNAKYDWKGILSEVRKSFGQEEEGEASGGTVNDSFGEIGVHVQFFNGIPMQIKLSDGTEEKRYSLPDKFQQAIFTIQEQSSNVVLDREWKEQGVRYGDFDDIGREVAEELTAAYSQGRLDRMISQISNKESAEKRERTSYKVSAEMLEEEDWAVRYAHMEQMNPDISDLPLLLKALDDPKASIRRLATVYLGMLETSEILPGLYKALKDSSVTVRRTAGDCISDLGDHAAMTAMMEALKDKSKLVRWRAAMFLYEVGDESALPALMAAQDDPEFEVSMQIKMAIERIQGGEEAKGSVWKQMTESRTSQ
ncbi:virulence factor [Bacillus lacus]|uniref:Virulence factor n=1 Tax=Metabacillus lacus TaxID=1983721 RepID=A0A7X2LX52_9BACI|nr:conserved virulence factor C family protein [Metabacillus lacus]MRX70911.1 virulence factor [Metabacillus lacus]